MENKLSLNDAQTILRTLVNNGCLAYYPKYHHHFPLMDAKLTECRFIGVYYKAVSESDSITFRFDTINKGPGGLFFTENDRLKSYCIKLEEYICGNQLKNVELGIIKSKNDPELLTIRDEIFEINT